MRLGLIARCDQSGLANQTWEYHRNLAPAKTLLINVGHLANAGRHCNKQSFPDRFPDATVVNGWIIDRRTASKFLHGLDVVLSAETFYGKDLSRLAAELGVKTVLACNPEFLSPGDNPTLWLPPTRWMWDTIPANKRLLPVPIPTDRFPVKRWPEITPRFLHVVGRPAVNDRNGTLDLLKALQHVTADITVTVRCQDRKYVPGLVSDNRIRVPSNVVLRINPDAADNYTDLYADGDVLVMPRRFGGLCLPVNEALGAGMPVIMSNIEPNLWLPDEWLVPAERQGTFCVKQDIDFFSVNPKQLAALVDRFATDQVFFKEARGKALELRDAHSWETLKPRYEEVLSNV